MATDNVRSAQVASQIVYATIGITLLGVTSWLTDKTFAVGG